MARTVVAIYDDFQTANNAVRDLVDNGFPRDNISIIANNSRGEYAYTAPTNTPATAAGTGENVAGETGAGAGVGAGIGAAIGGIGGLLVGLGALVIPGIGPVIAAGPLAVALSTLTGAGVGAVAGGVTGGLLGALIGLGIPEEEAEYYAEGVRRGGVLVTVQSEDGETDKVMELLNHHKPVDIRQRATQWREQGWAGYDPKAPQSIEATAVTQQSSTNQPSNYETEGMGHLSDETTQESRGTVEFSQPGNGDVVNEQNPNYHNHYNTYLSNSGYPFDYYAPAYQYGYGLASDARYQKSTWDVVSPDVRHNWELEHPGTWERFQTAIRHAWEDASGQS